MLRQPYIRQPRINPSTLYATSAYRPTALFDPSNITAPFNKLSQDIIIRAVSPFSVSDEATREAINKKYGTTTSQETMRNVGIVGGIVGATAATAATVILAGTKFAPAGFKLGTSLLSIPEPTMITKIAGGIIIAASVIGTLAAGYMAGKTIAQMSLTETGRKYSTLYFKNLGNSLINRPITTVMRIAATAATSYATKKITAGYHSGLSRGKQNTFLRILNWGPTKWTLHSIAQKGSTYLGGLLDDHFHGEMSEQQQMSYTTLLSVTGDFRDAQQLNPVLRAIATSPVDGQESIKRLASAYGLTDEYKPYRFTDVREMYDLTTNSAFADGIIDMIGETVLDTDFAIRHLSKGTEKNMDKVSAEVQRRVIKKILEEESDSKVLFMREDKIASAEKYIKDNELGKEYLSEYIDSLTAEELQKLGKDLKITNKDIKKEIIENENISKDVLIKAVIEKETTEKTYTDSPLSSQYFFKNKLFQNLIKEYIKEYKDPNLTNDPKKQEAIRKSNDVNLDNLLNKISTDMLNMGYEVGDDVFLKAKKDLKNKLEEVMIGTFESPGIVNKFHKDTKEIEKNIYHIGKIINESKEKPMQKNAEFSLDSLLINEILENPKPLTDRQLRNIVYSNAVLRFYNEIQDVNHQTAQWITNFPRKVSTIAAKAAMNKLNHIIKDYTVENLNKDLEDNEKYKKEVKERHERLETLKVAQEKLEKKRDELFNELISTPENQAKIKEMQKKLDEARAKLDNANKENSEEIKKLKKAIKDLEENLQGIKNQSFKEFLNHDEEYLAYMKIVEANKRSIEREEEYLAKVSKYNTSVSIDYDVIDEDGRIKTKSYKIENDSDLKKAAERFKELTDKGKTRTLEETDELNSLKRQIPVFILNNKNKEISMSILKSKLFIHLETMHYNEAISKTKALILARRKNNYWLTIPLTEKFKNITQDEYTNLINKAESIFGDKTISSLTKKEIEESPNLTEEEKELLKEYIDLDDKYKELLKETSGKKTESTQQDIEKTTEAATSVRRRRKIRTLTEEEKNAEKIKMAQMLREIWGDNAGDFLNGIINNLIDGNPIDINLYYATEFFTLLQNNLVSLLKDKKETGDDVVSSLFILNDPALHKEIEKEFRENKQLKEIMNRLLEKGILKTDMRLSIDGLTRREELEVKADYRALRRMISELISDLKENGLITEIQEESFKSGTNIDALITSLLNTHQKMRPTEDKYSDAPGVYKKNLDTLTENDILQILYEKFLMSENSGFHERAKEIEKELGNINEQIDALYKLTKEKFSTNQVPILVLEHLRKDLYSITNSPVINAINSKYLRRGGLHVFETLGINPFSQKPLKLKEQNIERISKDFNDLVKKSKKEIEKGVKNELQKIEGNISENILEKMKEIIEGSILNADAIEQMFFALGIEGIDDKDKAEKATKLFVKTIVDNLKLDEIDAIEANNKFNHKILEDYNKTTNLILDKITQNRNLDDDVKNELQVVILDAVTRIKHYKKDSIKKVIKSKAKEDITGYDENALITAFKNSKYGQLLSSRQIQFIVRGQTDKISENIVFDPLDKDGLQESLTQFFKEHEIPSEDAIKTLKLQEGLYKNKDGIYVELLKFSQLYNGSEKSLKHIPSEWRRARHEKTFRFNTKEHGDVIMKIEDGKMKMYDIENPEVFIGNADPELHLFFKGFELPKDNDLLAEEMTLNNFTIQQAIREQRKKELTNIKPGEETKDFDLVYVSDPEGTKHNQEKVIKKYGSNSILSSLVERISNLNNNTVIDNVKVSDVRTIDIERTSKRKFNIVENEKGENVVVREKTTETTKYRILSFETEIRDLKKEGFETKKKRIELFVPEMEGTFNEETGEFEPMKISEVIDEQGVSHSIPIEGAYRINGNLYIQQKVFNEEHSKLGFMTDIETTILNEMRFQLDPKNADEFTPYLSQQKLFNIFYDQRTTSAEGINEEVSDFVYVDDSKDVDYQILLRTLSERMTDEQKKLISTDYDSFVDTVLEPKIQVTDLDGNPIPGMYDNKYSLRSVPSNPNVILRNVKVRDTIIDSNGVEIEVYRHVPLNDVYMPLNRSYEIVGRSSGPVFALGQAKRHEYTNTTIKYEEPLMQTKYMKNNPALLENSKIGLNLKVHLMDYYNDSEGSQGATTHEDIIVVPATYDEEKKVWVHPVLGTITDGIKLMNRHTNKNTIKIEDAKEVRKVMGLKEDEALPEVIISKSSVTRRGLNAFLAELSATKDIQVDENRNFYREDGTSPITYVDNDKNILENNIDDINVETGYSYFSITDTLTDGINEKGYKASGDRTKEDMKDITSSTEGINLGIEELYTFALTNEISKIENGERISLDYNQKILNFVLKKSEIKSNEELSKFIYVDDSNQSELTGKAGKVKNDFFKRTMANSGYNKIMANTKLKHNEVYLPKQQLIEMEIYDGENWIGENSNYGIILRSPTQGRRSFIFVEYKVDPNEDSKVMSLSLSMHNLLNADHDGDGMSHFSLKGATDEEREAFKFAFEHNYEKDSEFTDMRIYDALEDIKNIEGIEIEQESFAYKNRVNRDNIDAFKREADIEEYELGKKTKYTKKFNEKHNKLTSDGLININKDEDFETSYLKQYTLKEYSGKLTGEFDFIDQWYLSDKEHREWFEELIDFGSRDGMHPEYNEAREKLQELGVDDFYSFTSLLKDFYAQKTFDYTKHGREEYRLSFERFYDLVQRNKKENFQEHIIKVIFAAHSDITMFYKTEGISEAIESKNKNEYEAFLLKHSPETIEILKENLKKPWYKIQRETKKELLLEKIKEALVTAYTNNLETTKKELIDRFMIMEEKFAEEKLLPYFESDDEIKERQMPSNEEFLTNRINSVLRKHEMEEIESKDIEGVTPQGWHRQYINIYNASLDFTINNEKVQGFNYILSKIEKGNHYQENELIRPIYKSITETIVDLFKGKTMLSPEIIKDLYITLNYKDTAMSKRIRIIDLLQANGRQITDKNFATYLSGSAIYKYNIAVNRKLLDLENENLENFHFESVRGFINNKELEAVNNRLKTNFEESIVKSLNKLGHDRHVNLSPLFHNHVSYETGLFFGVNKALSNISITEENKEAQLVVAEGINLAESSALVSILAHSNDVKGINELKNAVTPYLLFQTISKFITGTTDEDGKETYIVNNLIRHLFENNQKINLFEVNRESLESADEVSNTALLKEAQKYGIISLDEEDKSEYKDKESYDSLLKKFREVDPDITNRELSRLFHDFHAVLVSGNNYGAHLDFNNMSQEQKLNYLTKIHQIRKGYLVDNSNKDYGLSFSEEDFKLNKYSTITPEARKNIMYLYKKAEKLLVDYPILDKGTSIKQELKKEKEHFVLLNKFVRDIPRDLRRNLLDQESRQNAWYYNEEGELRFLNRQFSSTDNTRASIFYISSTTKDKQEQYSTQRLLSNIRKPYEQEGAQSEIGQLNHAINKSDKVHNAYLDLYRLSGIGGASEVSERIREQLNSFSPKAYLIPHQILEYFQLLNEFSAQISRTHNTEIMPHTIERFRLDIQNHIVVNTELEKKSDNPDITLNNVYKHLYNEHVMGLSNEELTQLREVEQKLLTYLQENPHTHTFFLEPADFIKVFYGKLLYEQSIGVGETIDEFGKGVIVARSIQEQNKIIDRVVDIIKEENEFKNRSFFKQSWQITSQLLEDEADIDKILDENNIHDERREAIKEKLQNFNKRLKLILEQDHLDTLLMSQLAQFPRGLNIKNKSLYNIYSQISSYLSGNEILTSDVLGEEIGNMITDIHIKNKKLHTAAVDVKLTMETLLSFAELQKRINEKTNDEINIFENLEPEQGKTIFKDKIMGLLDPEKRQNYMSFDVETTFGTKTGIYELSYIYFDENGKEQIVQDFLIKELNDEAIAFLKSKGYTDEHINNIKREMLKNTFGFNKEAIERFLKIAQNKTFIGQNISYDIGQINYEYEQILKSEINKEIINHKIETNQVFEDIETMTFEEVKKRMLESKDYLDDKQDIKLLLKIEKEIIKKFKKDFMTKYSYGNNLNYTPEEREFYSEKMTELFKVFLKGTNNPDNTANDLANIINQHYNLTLTADDLQPIIDEYNKAINGIKENGFLITTTQLIIDEKYGNIVLRDEPLLGKNGEKQYKKIVNDVMYDKDGNLVTRETDSNTIFNEMFIRQDAFYTIVDSLQEIMHMGTLSFKENNAYEYMNKRLSTVDENYFTSNSDKTLRSSYHYERYKKAVALKDDKQAYIELKEAFKYKDKEKKYEYLNKELFAYGDDFYKIDAKDLENAIREKVEGNIEPLLNMDNETIRKKAEEFITFKKLLDAEIEKQLVGIKDKEEREAIKKETTEKFLKTQERDTQLFVSKFYETGWEIATKVDQQVDKHIMAEALGVHQNDDIIELLVNEYNAILNELKDKGVSLEFSTGNVNDKIEYEENLDMFFKRMAFNGLLNTDKKYLTKYIFKLLNDDISEDHFSLKQHDANYKNYLAEQDEIINPLKTITKHNETNKTYFDNARVEFKNLIMNAALTNDWRKVDEYIKNRPLAPEEEGTIPQDVFKAEFNRVFNELKEKGITIKDNSRVQIIDGKVEFSVDVVDEETQEAYKINYEETEAIKKMFIEETINEIWEEINKNLYVEKIRTTVNPNEDLEGKLTYYQYINNIKDYAGRRLKSSFKEEVERTNNIREASKSLFHIENKINQLSKYQRPVKDFREAFAYYNEYGEKRYNDEAFYESLTTGYLSKMYKISLITNLSEKDLQTFKRKIEENDTRETNLNALANLAKDDKEFQDIIEKLRNQNSPVVKFIEPDSFEQFQMLLNNSEDFISLGLTSVTDINKIMNISYRDYEVPRALGRITNSLVRFQKFMAVTSPGFYLNMAITGLHKNYSAILGNDDIMFRNKRFFGDLIQTKSLISSYNQGLKHHTEFLAEMSLMTNKLQELENKMIIENGTINLVEFNNHRDEVIRQLQEKIININDFLDIIYDQGQTDVEASDLYKGLSGASFFFEQSIERLQNLDPITDLELYKSEIGDIYLNYIMSSFTEKTIMNDPKYSQLKITDENFAADKQKLLDTLNLMNLIHKSEEAGLMYTPFDKSGGKEASDIYHFVNGITKQEGEKNLLLMGIEKAVDGATFVQGKMIGYFNRFQRIHGMLLDMYVNGMTEDQAIAESLYRFYNFKRTPFENEAILFFPYMSYAIRDLEYQIDMLSNRRYMDFMYNIAQGMETMYRKDHKGDPYNSTDYHNYAHSRGWIPLGQDYGLKIGNPMFNAMSLIDNPFDNIWKRKNPIIGAIENTIGKNEFNARDLASGRLVGRISDVFTRDTNRPPDILPSVFFKRYDYSTNQFTKYTPYKYRVKYDYRNLNRELFFSDGSRRKPSRNPYTTARNALYKARVNASINRRLRG